MLASISTYVPQCVSGNVSRRGPLAIWLIVVTAALIFLSLIALAPLALAQGQALASQLIYRAFSLVCHQIPGRSFDLKGHPLAVCARCSGLYVGFAAGALCYPLVRSLKRRDTPARMWLVIGALPVTIDFALGFLRLWENTHLSRFVTGALFGAVVAIYVIPGLVDFNQTDWRRFFARPSEREQRTSMIGHV